jgi:ketosteroid isomerase-like protein
MGIDAEKQKAIIEDYIDAYNAFDVEAMISFIHPKVVFKNIVGNETNARASGVDAFREMAEQSKSLFSSRCQRITRFSSIGDTATVDIKYEGVLTKDLPNGMKAGDTLQLNGRSEFQFKDGKIYKITDYSYG